MKTRWKIIIRISSLLFYFTFFWTIYLGLYVFLASTPTIQEQRNYTNENRPEYFPVLVVEDQGGREKISLRSLGQEEYGGINVATPRPWHLYKKHETAQHLQDKGITYHITSLSPQREQVSVSIHAKNDQRTTAYTYEIEGETAYPRSMQILSSFGHNFSPMPFLVIITALLIFLSEKFLIRRLFKSVQNNSNESCLDHKKRG